MGSCVQTRNKININKLGDKEELESNENIKRPKKVKILFKESSNKSKLEEELITPYCNYKQISLMYEDQFGKVYKVIHNKTQLYRSMKIYNIGEILTKKDEDDILNEFNILKDITHPNIVKVFELYYYKNSYYVIYEFLENTILTNIIDVQKFLSEEESSQILYQILTAVEHFHSNYILLRNLDLDQVIINQTYVKKDKKYYNTKINFIGNYEK